MQLGFVFSIIEAQTVMALVVTQDCLQSGYWLHPLCVYCNSILVISCSKNRPNTQVRANKWMSRYQLILGSEKSQGRKIRPTKQEK